MVTIEQAERGRYFHVEGQCSVSIGLRGRVYVKYILYKANGNFKEWRDGSWKLPLKHGFYDYADLNDTNCQDWHLEKECAALQEAQVLRELPPTQLVHMAKIGYGGVTN